MVEPRKTHELYARRYMDTLPEPCWDCSPLYRAGYRALEGFTERGEFWEAYVLGMELERGCSGGIPGFPVTEDHP